MCLCVCGICVCVLCAFVCVIILIFFSPGGVWLEVRFLFESTLSIAPLVEHLLQRELNQCVLLLVCGFYFVLCFLRYVFINKYPTDFVCMSSAVCQHGVLHVDIESADMLHLNPTCWI